MMTFSFPLRRALAGIVLLAASQMIPGTANAAGPDFRIGMRLLFTDGGEGDFIYLISAPPQMLTDCITAVSAQVRAGDLRPGSHCYLEPK